MCPPAARNVQNLPQGWTEWETGSRAPAFQRRESAFPVLEFMHQFQFMPAQGFRRRLQNKWEMLHNVNGDVIKTIRIEPVEEEQEP